MNKAERTARFNQVVEFLNKQGERSLGPKRGSCRYRGQNGSKCAVGFFITDEEYDPAMEGTSLSRFRDLKSLNIENDVDVDFYFLLQNFHDRGGNWDFGKKCLKPEEVEEFKDYLVEHNYIEAGNE